MIEKLLQLLIREIDTQLLKSIELELNTNYQNRLSSLQSLLITKQPLKLPQKYLNAIKK